MEVVYERCCGIDVHKKIIVACFKVAGKKQQLKEFGTMTQDIKDMVDWLQLEDCQMVAMESTGSYWKPLYNIMEVLGLDVMVVNASHIKNVPGRKTDKKDAEWIAELLQHGLVKPSFIPDREHRELRELSRYRKSMVEERAREVNRLSKMLEGANVKLSSVASNINGKSSRRLIDILLDGDVTASKVSSALDNSMMPKLDSIMHSIEGVITPTQKRLFKAVLSHIDDMTKRIADLDDMINDEMKKYDDAIKNLDGIPGIGIRSAQTILAEIGTDMSRFPDASHLASWAGLCPGNNESAGKRRSGKTNKGDKALKTTLIQCARAAAKSKDNFFRAQYDRLVVRRGSNRAAVAVAHSMIIAIYHILKYNQPFKDNGVDYYNQFNREKKIQSYINKLKTLGCEISACVS